MLRSIAALGLLSAVAAAADLFPFVLPWDDASPSVISLAHLNEKPAGRDGFVRVKAGHLFAGEQRLRIFGVNTCFGANFPTHEAAEKVAARMAKFGINCVRFHHMDMFSAPGGIFAKDGKTLDAERLDRLDYFIAKLKENGIYADLNLHVSRTYPDRPKAEKKTNPDYDKGVDNYCAAMIALQKDYARDLLTHKNAYTGNRYADEPAVALVEINNENALGFQWWAGQMDDLLAPYAAEFGTLWSAWVKQRYGSDEKALAAWAEGAKEPGPDILIAGGKWFHEQHGTAVAKGEEIDGRVRVNVEKAGAEGWHAQFSRSGLKVAKGDSYEARFRVRGPKAMTLTVALQQAHEPWKVLGSANVKIEPEWGDATALMRASDADENARLTIGGLGQTTGAYEFETFSLRVAGVDGRLARAADGSLAPLRKSEFARQSPAKQRDWQQFIWDTETKYWNGMRDFLKTEVGVKAPIVGTQGFWSPASVQAGMDVIDSHAYWHHPDFQGRGWNQDVWSVKNESMAGAPDGGELGRLAAQRVAGKPFICTEYNHPAPNTYSAETFPLVLAFAAAQDWDGVFAFAYSHRGDEWDQPHFNNFFDIDRHSVKMATLPGSVMCFRRGDIPPMEQVALLSMSARDAVDAAIRSGPGFVKNRPEFKAVDLFRTRFGMNAPFTAATEINPTEESTRTETRLYWQAGSKRVASFSTKRSAMIVGQFEEDQVLPAGVFLRHRASRQGWACFQFTALEGDLPNAKRMLITATGDTENTGQVWKSPDKTSVGRAWGKAPVLVEGPSAEIDFSGAGPWRVWALDETGRRRVEIPLKGNRRTIGPQHRTLWYEVSRE